MKKILPYLLLVPMILIMGVLVFYPIIATFSYSLKKWQLTAPGDIHFIGLQNYSAVLTSGSFWYSFQNTLFLLVIVVLLATVSGFLLSAFLNVDTKYSGCLLAIEIGRAHV